MGTVAESKRRLRKDGIEGALALSLSQIVHGEASCSYCNRPADVLVATGADPKYEPMCWQEAREMVTATTAVFDRIFYRPEGIDR